MMMEKINCRDDDNIGFLLFDHLVKLCVLVRLHFFTAELDDVLVCYVHASLVRIADSNKLGDIFEVLDDSLVVHSRANAHANNDIALNLRSSHDEITMSK